MNLFDLHIDTPYEMYGKGCGIINDCLQVSLGCKSEFEAYSAICAIWSDNSLDNERAYEQFFSVEEHFSDVVNSESGICKRVQNYNEFDDALKSGKSPLFLSVEGGRIINSDISRLKILYDKGVRFLTFMWKGEDVLGGSHDTEAGLTEFGRAVADKCFELGIIPDISHASERTADELFDIAAEKGKRIIASHSNAYTIHPHSRNLHDAQFKRIVDTGGLVGLNFCPLFINGKDTAEIDEIIRHADYFLSNGGEDILAIGTDFDGITDTPRELKKLSDMWKLYEAFLRHNYSETLVNKIFYDNAAGFVKYNFI
jgi:membrane dipeptidase